MTNEDIQRIVEAAFTPWSSDPETLKEQCAAAVREAAALAYDKAAKRASETAAVYEKMAEDESDAEVELQILGRQHGCEYLAETYAALRDALATECCPPSASESPTPSSEASPPA